MPSGGRTGKRSARRGVSPGGRPRGPGDEPWDGRRADRTGETRRGAGNRRVADRLRARVPDVHGAERAAAGLRGVPGNLGGGSRRARPLVGSRGLGLSARRLRAAVQRLALPASWNDLAPKLLFALAYCLFAVLFLKRGLARRGHEGRGFPALGLLAWLVESLRLGRDRVLRPLRRPGRDRVHRRGGVVQPGPRGPRGCEPGRGVPLEVDPGGDRAVLCPRPRGPPRPRPAAGRCAGDDGDRLPGELPDLGARDVPTVSVRLSARVDAAVDLPVSPRRGITTAPVHGGRECRRVEHLMPGRCWARGLSRLPVAAYRSGDVGTGGGPDDPAFLPVGFVQYQMSSSF